MLLSLGAEFCPNCGASVSDSVDHSVLRHIKAWGLAWLGGVGALLISLYSAGGCIEPPQSHPDAVGWEAPGGCIFTTEYPYWVIGIIGDLIVFVVILNHYYGPFYRRH